MDNAKIKYLQLKNNFLCIANITMQQNAVTHIFAWLNFGSSSGNMHYALSLS